MNLTGNPFSTQSHRPLAEHNRNLRALCSPEQLQTFLQLERLRADRTGGIVSAVIFEAGKNTRSEKNKPSRTRRVAALALQASRVTDTIGTLLHGEEQICALLPGTSFVGTERFADRVRALALRSGIEINATIYSYPTDSIPHDASTNGPNSGPHNGGHRRSNGEHQVPSWRGRPARELVPGQTTDRIALECSEPAALRIPAILPFLRLLNFRMPLWKRSIDIVGAIVGLILFSPVMLISAALIRFSTNGPIIFTQLRAGWRGREFTIYKFRTMTTDAEQRKSSLRKFSEQDGPAFKMTHDPRVTLIGRFLRATSLDELPQFWNVLVGNMSLVGPRPLPVEEANACGQWHRRRLDVMPGLTCIWQVRGRSSVAFDDWMRMDMEYIDHRSPLRDLSILLLTIPAVALRKGAH